MKDLNQLLGFSISVGYGNAAFPMNRGSFKYKEKLVWKHTLEVLEPYKSENQYEFPLLDPRTGAKGKAILKEQDSDYEFFFELDEMQANRFWVTFPTSGEEHIYGCGETFSEFDLKGQQVRIWVAEHQNANRIGKKIVREKLLGKHPRRKLSFDRYESYYVQPTFVSSDKYFVHVDGSSYMEFDFRKPEITTLYTRETPHILIKQAESFSALSERLSAMLGHQRRLPDWIFDGAILAVQEGCARIDEKINRAISSGIKIAGIWSQDWCGCRRTDFGYQVMWNWKWDEELYPNLNQKILEWKEKGIRFLGYINPFMAIEKPLYQEASAKGYCVKDKEGKDYLVTITTFPAAMIDFTNPAAYAWYKEVIKTNMIGLGMGGWMADFGEYLPPDCVLYSGEDPELVHNAWPAIWARMNREAIEECKVQEEVFFFTRAGFTGTIADSAMMWNGDQHVDWSVDDGLPSVIPATLSLAMSGFGICHSDAGGYTTVMHIRRDKELLMRWVEMNAFSPLLRTHEGNQPVNNVQFDLDEELLLHMAKMTDAHVALKPYLKAAIEECVTKGIPVMRPLFYHYEEESAYVEASEYLLGRDILVAPILEGGVASREVYFPEDEWKHLFTGKIYRGGSSLVDAPIGCPPVFVRTGAKFDIPLHLS